MVWGEDSHNLQTDYFYLHWEGYKKFCNLASAPLEETGVAPRASGRNEAAPAQVEERGGPQQAARWQQPNYSPSSGLPGSAETAPGAQHPGPEAQLLATKSRSPSPVVCALFTPGIQHLELVTQLQTPSMQG